MLKICGLKNSINVMTVLWPVDQFGLAFDRMGVGCALAGTTRRGGRAFSARPVPPHREPDA